MINRNLALLGGLALVVLLVSDFKKFSASI